MRRRGVTNGRGRGAASRVDEKLTERRDEEWVSGIEGSRQKGSDQQFRRCSAVTRVAAEPAAILDAQEVRGIGPCAHGHRVCSTNPQVVAKTSRPVLFLTGG